MDFGQFLSDHGFATAAAVAAGWFVVRLVNFTLNDLRQSLGSLESITIKLIERHNESDRRLAEVSERLAKLEQQAADNYQFLHHRRHRD